MVMILNPLEIKTAELVEQLFASADLPKCCPHINKDSEGPDCGKDRAGCAISNARRNICDTASMQLWCLDPARYDKCLFYNKPHFSI
jgi:hypothetical protein